MEIISIAVFWRAPCMPRACKELERFQGALWIDMDLIPVCAGMEGELWAFMEYVGAGRGGCCRRCL